MSVLSAALGRVFTLPGNTIGYHAALYRAYAWQPALVRSIQKIRSTALSAQGPMGIR